MIVNKIRHGDHVKTTARMTPLIALNSFEKDSLVMLLNSGKLYSIHVRAVVLREKKN